MPTYVYGCADCGAQFEQFQRFSDAALTICPRCQGTIKRIFQPVGIVFKGSGWYITDSRKNTTGATTSSTPAATTAATDTPPASEPKADSTPKADKPADTASTPAPATPAAS